MKVLATGAAGFIGSHATERLLSEGCGVEGVDNFDPYYPEAQKKENLSALKKSEKFSFRQGDFAEITAAQLKGTDVVLHLAARPGVTASLQYPQTYMDNNVTKTALLLEACRKADVPMVFASSSSVYGNDSKPPFTEDQPAASQESPYGVSKRAGELLCKSFHSAYGLPVTCLRFFTVFGPRIRPDLALHIFTRKVMKGEAIEVYGDGSSYRDYTHYSDIVGGISFAINKQKKEFQIYNLASSRPITLDNLIIEVEKAVGKKAKIQRKPARKGDVFGTYGDTSKAKAALGYSPKKPFAEGLKELAEWMKPRI